MEPAGFHNPRLQLAANPVAGALALSLVFHLLLFGALEVGRHLHLRLPEWLKAIVARPALSVEQRKNPPPATQEVPLLFVEVDPSQPAAEPPKDTKNYSVVNSLAANPDVELDSNKPKLDGVQDKVPKIVDTLRPTPRQPLTPLEPEPRPFKPEPETSPEPKPGDLALAKPADPKPKEVETPKRPRTLAEANAQTGLISGQKMKEDGGVKRHGVVQAFDAKGTAVGVYDAALIEAVQQCWYNILDETTTPSRPGKVVVEFQLHSDGYVTDVKVMETDVGELHSLFCQLAIQKPAPFKRWPDGMRKEIGRDYRQLKFTFSTNTKIMWEFLKAGGPFMFLLVTTSIVGLTFIIERGLALRWKKVIPPELEDAVERCRSKEDLDGLHVICDRQPSALSRLLMIAAEHLNWPKAENADAIQTRARHEIAQLERGLVILEIVVGIAPLLGLVGTIHGLITLFGDLGRTGMNDNAALARGIAIALNTTLAGLLTAIPSLIAWSYYNKKVETLAIELETLCDEFLRRFYRYEQND